MDLDRDGKWIDDLFRRLCAGEVHESPFVEGLVLGLASNVASVFDDRALRARETIGDLVQLVR